MQRAVYRLAATALAAAFALTGCSTSKATAPANVPTSLQVGMAAPAPTPVRMQSAAPGQVVTAAQGKVVTTEYQMRPGDDLKLRFLYHKELDTTGKIRDD